MPTYEYKCEDGHEFEVQQSMTDDPVTKCPVCGKPVQRVFRPVAIHFKGSGFYTTDYAKKKSVGGSSQDGAGKESGSGGDEGSKDSKESKGSDSGAKPEKAAKSSAENT